MAFSDAPGPATRARQVISADETVLWAASGDRFVYDAADAGEQSPVTAMAGLRVSGAFDRGAVSVAERMTADVEDDEAGNPDVVVFGGADGLARTALRDVPPTGRGRGRTWALTSSRLLVLDVKERDCAGQGSLLRRSIEFGRDIVDLVTDRIRKYGGNVSDVPVTCPPMEVVASVDRRHIDDITVSRRRLRMRTRPCLRLSFMDSSGIDLLLGIDDVGVFEWMLALSGGGR
ncbi:hypothetical protein [Saccharomonospora xinjiangensis]|uniref:Uncharacterized protein n=1 Tax=Saccharomonospora xinjiangensis XJ-54 TaxID=882086 RepID=I0V1Z4_9PSEU|nr:hypothetical protein [Saccharomonospora xinjiangensis]EID54147.1 hypothetical protein SacxiDRAFT_1910 [Saccharomonospora xinjiangensis XJ-54]